MRFAFGVGASSKSMHCYVCPQAVDSILTWDQYQKESEKQYGLDSAFRSGADSISTYSIRGAHQRWIHLNKDQSEAIISDWHY
jgi:hypothetical protein